jgi:hypothetical protein
MVTPLMIRLPWTMVSLISMPVMVVVMGDWMIG